MPLSSPNAAQVERFVERLSRLSRQQWWAVLQKKARARAAFGDRGLEGASDFYGGEKFHLWGQEAEALLKPLSLADSYGAETYFEAARAVLAVILCEGLSRCAFAANYGAFADIVPISTLGDGLAPEIGSLPVADYDLFLSRVGCFAGPSGTMFSA